MDGHGIDGLVAGQAGGQDAAQFIAIAASSEEDPQLPACCSPRQADVAVVELLFMVVDHHHHRLAVVERMRFLPQLPLHGAVEGLGALGPFAQGAQQAQFVEQRQAAGRGFGRSNALEQRQHPPPQQLADDARSALQPFQAGLPGFEGLDDRIRVAPVNRGRQAADPPVGMEAAAVPQGDHVIGQGRRRAFRQGQLVPREFSDLIHQFPAVACATFTAQVRHDPARLHRGELVAIAQQDEPCGIGQRGEQSRHHGQVHHGDLVDDEQVQAQRVVRTVAGPDAARAHAQQAVQGLGLSNLLQQFGGGFLDGFGEAPGGLAGGGGQRHPQGTRPGLFQQQFENARHRPGLSGARPAGDDAQPPADRQSGGHALEVGVHGRGAEEPFQPFLEPLPVDFRRLCIDQGLQALDHLPLPGVVAGQVEALFIEDQRLVLLVRPSHQRFLCQSPGIHFDAQFLQRSPAVQGQADVATAYLGAGQGGEQPQLFPGVGVEAQQVSGQVQIGFFGQPLLQSQFQVVHAASLPLNSWSSASMSSRSGRRNQTPRSLPGRMPRTKR